MFLSNGKKNLFPTEQKQPNLFLKWIIGEVYKPALSE